jgi:hypothetical protein
MGWLVMSTGEHVTGDRAAAIAALTATLTAGLDKDEAVADAAQKVAASPWLASNSLLLVKDRDGVFDTEVAAVSDYRYDDVLIHAARHDPARERRDIKAKRDLMSAILAERHDYNPSDEYYSCSQAVGDDPDPNVSLARGSGCSDPDRAGQPCDCGRDARVERLLRILAGIYEEAGR